MNREIKNRIEAYLSWLSTGIQPEGWDLEQPRNKQEVWLLQKAQRLDRIERENGENGGEVETGRKAALRSSNEGTYDYNALDNIPILPKEGLLVEGQYYYQLGSSEIDFDHRTYTDLQAFPIPSGATSGLYVDTRYGIEDVVAVLEEMASHTEPTFDEEDVLRYSVIQLSTTDPQYVLEVPLFAVKQKTDNVWVLTLFGMLPVFASSDIEFSLGETVILPAGWNSINPQTGEVSSTETILFEQGLLGIASQFAGQTAYIKNTEVCDLLLGIDPPTQKKETIGQIVNNEFIPLAVGSNEPVTSKLVQHNVKLGHQTYSSNTEGLVTICNDSTTTFDYTSLRNYLKDYSTYNYYTASGLYNGEYIYGIYVDANSYISLIYGQDSSVSIDSSELIVTDNPIEIL